TPLPGLPRRSGGVGRILVFGLLGLLLAAGGGLVGGLIVHQVDTRGTGSSAAAMTNAGPTNVKVMDRSSLADIAAVIKPSVVVIQAGNGEGSGVVFNTDGYIVTNNHVVAAAQGGAVQVNFANGKSAAARVVGTDRKTDLAVVRVTGVSGLTPA